MSPPSHGLFNSYTLSLWSNDVISHKFLLILVEENEIRSNLIDDGESRRGSGSIDLGPLTLGQNGQTVRSAPIVQRSLIDVEIEIKGMHSHLNYKDIHYTFS